MELLCCSWDGTVAFIDFTAEEIGNPLSQQEVVSITKCINNNLHSVVILICGISSFFPVNWILM